MESKGEQFSSMYDYTGQGEKVNDRRVLVGSQAEIIILAPFESPIVFVFKKIN